MGLALTYYCDVCRAATPGPDSLEGTPPPESAEATAAPAARASAPSSNNAGSLPHANGGSAPARPATPATALDSYAAASASGASQASNVKYAPSGAGGHPYVGASRSLQAGGVGGSSAEDKSSAPAFAPASGFQVGMVGVKHDMPPASAHGVPGPGNMGSYGGALPGRVLHGNGQGAAAATLQPGQASAFGGAPAHSASVAGTAAMPGMAVQGGVPAAPGNSVFAGLPPFPIPGSRPLSTGSMPVAAGGYGGAPGMSGSAAGPYGGYAAGRQAQALQFGAAPGYFGGQPAYAQAQAAPQQPRPAGHSFAPEVLTVLSHTMGKPVPLPLPVLTLQQQHQVLFLQVLASPKPRLAACL